MNVAISTWHTGDNAGTFFQLYGLYSYIQSRGHHVEVIDYVMTDSDDMLPRGFYYYFSQFIPLLKKKLHIRKYRITYANATKNYLEELKLRDAKFTKAYSKLCITKQISTEADFQQLNSLFDVFVIGSDQVWNPAMLNKRYLLDYVASGKIKASYAPSVGSACVMKYQLKMFKKYLADFNFISTREKLLADTLNKELLQDVKHVLDPSMLIDKEKYAQIAYLPEQFVPNTYLLCYFMPRHDKQKEQIRQYAKDHNLKIVVMSHLAKDYDFTGADIYVEAGPEEFIGLISNAAAVFTSSFHCTIFSILFNRNLFVFQQQAISKSADINQRYLEQLQTYGMSHRYIPWMADITNENLKDIDYDMADKIFNERRDESMRFLNQFV